VAVKEGAEKGVELMGEEVWGLQGCGTLVCVWVSFHCGSGGCLCQGLQRDRVVYGWYNRLISGWYMLREEE
jgi:hypothetical protein